MSNLSALKQLRDSVAAGTLPEGIFHGCHHIRDHWAYATGLTAPSRRLVFLAYRGSLDAAKALHEALLPGWWWVKPDGPESGTIRVVGPDNGEYYPSAVGRHADPARSWLVAILDALIAGDEK